MLLEVWRKEHKFVFKNMAGMLNKILQKHFPKDVFFKTAVMQICKSLQEDTRVEVAIELCCVFAKYTFEEHLWETASEFVML